MSITREAIPAVERSEASVNLEVKLSQISQLGTPTEQFYAFATGDVPYVFGPINLEFSSVADGGSFDQVVDFAASPHSSSSLLVRAQALEFAIQGMTLLAGTKPEEAQANGARLRLEELAQVAPLALNGVEVSGTFAPYVHHAPDRAPSHGSTIKRLMEREGIAEGVVYPDYEEFDHSLWEIAEANLPSTALSILTRLSDYRARPEELPPKLAKLLSLAHEVRQVMDAPPFIFVSDREGGQPDLLVASRPRIAEFGEDANQMAEKLVQLDDPLVTSCSKELNSLYELSGLLAQAYPARFSAGIQLGVSELLASSVYALYEHFAVNNRLTDVKLPLNDNPDALSLYIEHDYGPLFFLKSIRRAIQNIHEDTTRCPVIPVTNSRDFWLYRFMALRNGALGTVPGGSFNRTTAYIRPEASIIYDRRLEYGRPGEGVEASIGYVTDVSTLPQAFLELGRHRRHKGDDNRISIRLDREGVLPAERGRAGIRRDPTQAQGTLSLDFGSILGDDATLGTKIGRFLAWGNLLRAQALGIEPHLNHVTHYFEPQDGEASVFAAEAQSMIVTLDNRQLSRQEIRNKYGEFSRVIWMGGRRPYRM